MTQTTTLLVNLGTPARAREEDVRVFLAEFLSDPQVIDFPRWFWQPILRGMVLRRRPARVAELYESIWYTQPCAGLCPGNGCSPLECGTRRIAAALDSALPPQHRVDWCYRYGERSIASRLERAMTDGSSDVRVVSLFPQRTCSTTGSVIDETRRAAVALGISARVEVVEMPPDAAGYVEALAARARHAMAASDEPPEHILVSFHGIPTRYDRSEGGRYVRDCERTTAGFLAALGWNPDHATLCFQSKFGPEPWLKPATAALIDKLASEGVRRLAVVTPGFLTEGLETLEEIGQRGREAFLAAGGQSFTYLPAVQDHPAFVRALAEVVHPGTVAAAGTASRQDLRVGS